MLHELSNFSSERPDTIGLSSFVSAYSSWVVSFCQVSFAALMTPLLLGDTLDPFLKIKKPG